MGNAAEQLMKIVQKAAKLRDDHPDHHKLAVKIGDLMSPVFKTHGMLATTIPPILLSAAMEMLEHLDAVQQSFASAPQHPLKEKAHSITIARPTTAAKTSAGIVSAPALPKVKPMPKTKAAHGLKESKGNDIGPTRGNSLLAYTSSQKGKEKAVVPGNEEEAVETKTSKQTKVTQESVSLKHNALKEDITTDMAPQAANLELVAVAPSKNLNVLMPKPTLVNKAEHDLAQAASGWQKHPQMDVDNSHDGLTKVLEGMTLEVMQDSANLSARNATLQEIADTLQTNIAQLTGKNTAATENLNALQDRITAQDAALLELQDLWAEVMALQDQVKTLREESATRDQHLQRAQYQLGQQECTTAILQDAYNAIRQCLTGPPNSSSPFTNSLYLANPMYGGSQSMVPVSMGQMQAMEGLYFNLPSSVGNISSGSMLGGPSAGPSVSTIAGGTRTRGDTKGGVPSGDHFLPLLGFGASTIAALLRVLLAGTNDVNSFAAFVVFAALAAGGLSTVTLAFVCLAPAELEECII
ncbi:hypothetical protein EV424DRAFT_1351818 [Suillus variegatus]|nr:hypothetical protein EV424DRAFT_1351818 [Suillus variegatus]